MKNQYRQVVILLFLFLTSISLFSGGMELTHNVNPANFPQRLKDNAKYHPLSKGYIDVPKPPYNAIGDGINNDTNDNSNSTNIKFQNRSRTAHLADQTPYFILNTKDKVSKVYGALLYKDFNSNLGLQRYNSISMYQVLNDWNSKEVYLSGVFQ